MKTIRQQIVTLLEAHALSSMELAQELGILEKEVVQHLGHVRQTVAATGRKLRIIPCRCRKCNYLFKERRRFSRPGRCPQCRNSFLEPPRFTID